MAAQSDLLQTHLGGVILTCVCGKVHRKECNWLRTECLCQYVRRGEVIVATACRHLRQKHLDFDLFLRRLVAREMVMSDVVDVYNCFFALCSAIHNILLLLLLLLLNIAMNSSIPSPISSHSASFIGSWLVNKEPHSEPTSLARVACTLDNMVVSTFSSQHVPAGAGRWKTRGDVWRMKLNW